MSLLGAKGKELRAADDEFSIRCLFKGCWIKVEQDGKILTRNKCKEHQNSPPDEAPGPLGEGFVNDIHVSRASNDLHATTLSLNPFLGTSKDFLGYLGVSGKHFLECLLSFGPEASIPGIQAHEKALSHNEGTLL